MMSSRQGRGLASLQRQQNQQTQRNNQQEHQRRRQRQRPRPRHHGYSFSYSYSFPMAVSLLFCTIMAFVMNESSGFVVVQPYSSSSSSFSSLLSLPSSSSSFLSTTSRTSRSTSTTTSSTTTTTSSTTSTSTRLGKPLFMTSSSTTTTTTTTPTDPQVWSSGFSPKLDLLEALQEATELAMEGLPPPTTSTTTSSDTTASTTTIAGIDLAVVTISSLYDNGQVSLSVVVPAILATVSQFYSGGIQHVIGCTSGGIISSGRNAGYGTTTTTTTSSNSATTDEDDHDDDHDDDDHDSIIACTGIEMEGVPGVSVVLAVLPNVHLKTFHVLGDDVPDDVGRVDPREWKRAVGLTGFLDNYNNNNNNVDTETTTTTTTTMKSPKPAFFLIPSPSFQNELDDFMSGLAYNYPNATCFGGIASTVSSLSRARLFRYDAPTTTTTTGTTSTTTSSTILADGCVGLAMVGDLQVQTMVAQGTKPVGGIYRVVKGQESTIQAIMLDEAATQEANDYNEDDDDDDDDDDDGEESTDKNAAIAAAYAKAAIPKPPLAEANFVMRTLSDDDQSFMRKAILIGVERGGSLGRTPNELARLADGKGHRFSVYQVANAGMKDGSVTLPLMGRSANLIQPGTRVRFFVRESDFSKKEVQALWTGYKKKTLEATLLRSFSSSSFDDDDNDYDDEKDQQTNAPFEPAVCMLMSTLDRGTKFFAGKPGYETSTITQFLPSVPCIGGFFTNGVLGKLDDEGGGSNNELDNMVHASAATYVLIGSASRRPIYRATNPPNAATATTTTTQSTINRNNDNNESATRNNDNDNDDSKEEDPSTTSARSALVQESKAPRAPNGELILKRREVHSGRALSVATVEWSVADNMAKPSSTLEQYLWEKETQVDRLRERVPLSNLVSQCRLSVVDPSMPKPRDWIGPIMRRVQEEGFAIIPECKRSEPQTGTLRKRYDVSKLVMKFVKANVPAMTVNSDPVLFGGTLEDITTAREAASTAAMELATEDGMVVPPILASDLIIYPYQLYKMQLAGTDAVNLLGGALASKDLTYLTKIAASLKIQVLVTVTSTVQLQALMKLAAGSIQGLIVSNRELEDFSFDMTGQQALDLLSSEAMVSFREHHGADLPVLVEGRVGLIERTSPDGNDKSYKVYLQELKAAGAVGAIIGGGLAIAESTEGLEDVLLSNVGE